MLYSRNPSLRISLLFGVLSITVYFLEPWIAILNIPQQDLVQYWAAAKLFMAGENPYDTSRLFVVEQAAIGLTIDLKTAIVMYNPFFVLAYLWPLAFFSFADTKILWFAITLCAVFFSSIILFKLFHQSHRKTKRFLLFFHFAIVLVTFPPLYSQLYFGQISWLCLVSVSGFFIFLFRIERRFFLAGFCLGISLIKPHLAFLVYVALLLEITNGNAQRILLGVVVACGLAVSFTLLQSPVLLSWYLEFASEPPIFWQTPTLGNYVQALVGRYSILMRFTTTIIAVLVLIFLRWRYSFSLLEEETGRFYACVLLTLSFIVSPYGWLFDMLILLPAVFLTIFYCARSTPFWRWLCILLFLISHGACFAMASQGIAMQYYVWYPVFILTMLFLMRSRASELLK